MAKLRSPLITPQTVYFRLKGYYHTNGMAAPAQYKYFLYF